MINKTQPNIATPRCIIRLPEMQEAEIMHQFVLENKLYLQKWEPIPPKDYFKPNFWPKQIKQIREDFLYDKSCCMNIYLVNTQELVGMLGYSNFIRGAFQSCFLGYKIAEKMQNIGLATEAIKASINFIFGELNLHRISANYMPRNKASERVLEKSGFVKDGVAEEYLCINGQWEQHILTSLINKNWIKNE